MILTLFLVFVVIGIALIFLGMFIQSQSSLAIIGFLTLFVLSVFVILPGNLEYESGESTLTTSTVLGNTTTTNTTMVYSYKAFNDTTTHYFGYWLSVGAALGMFGVLYSLYKTNWREE